MLRRPIFITRAGTVPNSRIRNESGPGAAGGACAEAVTLTAVPRASATTAILVMARGSWSSSGVPLLRSLDALLDQFEGFPWFGLPCSGQGEVEEVFPEFRVLLQVDED